MRPLIVERYLLREIRRTLGAVLSALLLIFLSYSAIQVLADAVEGLLPGHMIAALLLLKALIALEVLVPIAFYLAVLIALGRMYRDCEITVVSACGFGGARIVGTVLVVSLALAALTGALSIYLRPWAYQQSYGLIAEARAESDITKLSQGRFYESRQGSRVVFVRQLARNHMEDVFVQQQQGPRKVRVIRAERGVRAMDEATAEPLVVLTGGWLYDLDRNAPDDKIIRFDKLTLRLGDRQVSPAERKRKAASLAALAASSQPEDKAELQWRLSAPLSTLLLGLLAVPLSRTDARQPRSARFVTAILLFAIYYNLTGIAVEWVEMGWMPAVPGIWWVMALLALTVAALLSYQPVRFWWARRKRRRRAATATVLRADETPP